MTYLTQHLKRHRLVAYFLTFVFSWALWISVQQLQASASAPPLSPAAVDPGTIAYVQMSTQDIHTISPDGTGDRVLWTNPGLSAMKSVIELAWRPDGRELAFSSQHEQACSWYDSDVYVIGYHGAGYRRITNSPACAALAGLPKGSVTVNVNNYTTSLIWVYVQGAPSVKTVLGGFFGTVTFDDVADFGPGVLQASIGIGGLDRFTSFPPYADVQPGQTVPGGNLTIMQYSGFRGFGAGKVSWKADGSALAYNLRTGICHQADLRQPALRLHRRGSPGGRARKAQPGGLGPDCRNQRSVSLPLGARRAPRGGRGDLSEHRGQYVWRHEAGAHQLLQRRDGARH